MRVGVKPEGVSPNINSPLHDQAAEVNTSDPALSTLTHPPCVFVFRVGVCVLANPAAGQLMKRRRRKGQGRSAVARCCAGLLLMGKQERAAQQEEDQADGER